MEPRPSERACTHAGLRVWISVCIRSEPTKSTSVDETGLCKRFTLLMFEQSLLGIDPALVQLDQNPAFCLNKPTSPSIGSLGILLSLSLTLFLPRARRSGKNRLACLRTSREVWKKETITCRNLVVVRFYSTVCLNSMISIHRRPNNVVPMMQPSAKPKLGDGSIADRGIAKGRESSETEVDRRFPNLAPVVITRSPLN